MMAAWNGWSYFERLMRGEAADRLPDAATIAQIYDSKSIYFSRDPSSFSVEHFSRKGQFVGRFAKNFLLFSYQYFHHFETKQTPNHQYRVLVRGPDAQQVSIAWVSVKLQSLSLQTLKPKSPGQRPLDYSKIDPLAANSAQKSSMVVTGPQSCKLKKNYLPTASKVVQPNCFSVSRAFCYY